MKLPITAVQVHRDGALVTRSGPLHFDDGVGWITGLPLTLDPASVRVHAAGTPLSQVRVELDLTAPDLPPRSDLDEAVQHAHHAVERHKATLDALMDQRRVLGELGPSGPTDPRAPLPTAERVGSWATLSERFDGWSRALDARIAEVRGELEDQRKAFERAKNDVRQASSSQRWAAWAPTRRVRVVAEVDEAEVDISYIVEGATWTPAYTLHTDALFRSGRFGIRALVAQSTGEDWSGVRMSLSTAPCQRQIAIPELAAMRLGAAQPRSPSAWRDLPAGLESLFPDDLRTAPTPRPGPPPQPAPPVPMMEEGAAAKPAPPRRRKQRENRAAPARPMRSAAPPAMPAPGGGGFTASQAAPMEDTPAPEPKAPPPPRRTIPKTLSYGRMRLRTFDAPVGQRGRLRTLDLEGEVRDAGLPEEAVQRAVAALESMRHRLTRFRALDLPPHHVLPEAVDGSDFRFDAEGEVDCSSNGRFQPVLLSSLPVDLTVRYRSVPRHDQRLYRRVSAQLATEAPLLPGPADVYVDGALTLTVPWAGSSGRGRLELGLGVEDGVKVVRNVRYREESAGIFGGSRRMFTEIEIDLASSLARPVEVELLERIPIAGSDDVSVEEGTCDPPAEPYTGKRDGPILKGGRRQVVKLPAGGQGRATLRYTVTLGNKEELVGGDRRG